MVSYELDETISQEELLGIIDELNHNDMVNGILVQLPLPKHIDEEAVIKAINDGSVVELLADFASVINKSGIAYKIYTNGYNFAGVSSLVYL